VVGVEGGLELGRGSAEARRFAANLSLQQRNDAVAAHGEAASRPTRLNTMPFAQAGIAGMPFVLFATRIIDAFAIVVVSVMSGIALLTLAACEQSSNPRLLRSNLAAFAPSTNEEILVPGSQITGNDGQKLAYTRSLLVEMSDDNVAPRFLRARTSCLEDQTLKCNLIEASITAGDANAGARPSATLSVRLPHDTVMKFEAALLQSLPGEALGEPSLRRFSTNGEDLAYQILDVDRRLAQANDYREWLTTLSTRTDVTVDNLIKAQEKLSEVQSSIEELTAQSRRLNTRAETDLLNISLSPDVSSPLTQAWHNSARALGDSAAKAFNFVVVVLPWLPLVAFGGLLFVGLWRRTRRRSALSGLGRVRTPGRGF
jgi:hypothetical protein